MSTENNAKGLPAVKFVASWINKNKPVDGWKPNTVLHVSETLFHDVCSAMTENKRDIKTPNKDTSDVETPEVVVLSCLLKPTPSIDTGEWDVFGYRDPSE